MELICDDNLCIWHLNFKIPGSKNNKTIMRHISFLNDIRNKFWPSVLPKFELQVYVIRAFHYLADVIYPKYFYFALPHPDPCLKEENRYGAHHCLAQNAMERVFGVLLRHF